MTTETGASIRTVASLDCRYTPVAWPFAIEQRAAIDRHWAEARRAKPAMFNGRVLMLTAAAVDDAVEGGLFRGSFTDTDFAAFLAYRDFGRPGGTLRNGFGMAALQAADGAFILGEMGPHTANAGRVYFPSGTPDLGDIAGDVVDIAGSIRRELAEETGLDLTPLAFAPTFSVIEEPSLTCIMQRVRAPAPAEVLVARIETTLRADPEPELARMHIVRSPADITAAVPPFVAHYLRHALAEDQPG